MRFEDLGPRSAAVRRLRRLQNPRARREAGLLLVEGVTVLREALRAGAAVVDLVVGRRALEAGRLAAVIPELEAAGVTAAGVVPDEVLAALSTMTTPHDVIAAVRPPGPRPGAPPGRIVALDGVQDPGNVGVILRTALAFGFAGAWAGQGTADPFGPKVLRSSAGAVFHLARIERVDLAAALASARSAGYRVYGLDAHQGEDPRGVDFPRRLVLVVGSEGRGLSEAARREVDAWLRVPVDERVESLNAATAAAIVCYEVGRRVL